MFTIQLLEGQVLLGALSKRIFSGPTGRPVYKLRNRQAHTNRPLVHYCSLSCLNPRVVELDHSEETGYANVRMRARRGRDCIAVRRQRLAETVTWQQTWRQPDLTWGCSLDTGRDDGAFLPRRVVPQGPAPCTSPRTPLMSCDPVKVCAACRAAELWLYFSHHYLSFLLLFFPSVVYKLAAYYSSQHVSSTLLRIPLIFHLSYSLSLVCLLFLVFVFFVLP